MGQSTEASRFAPHSVGDQPTHAAQNLRIFRKFLRERMIRIFLLIFANVATGKFFLKEIFIITPISPKLTVIDFVGQYTEIWLDDAQKIQTPNFPENINVQQQTEWQ